MKFVIVSLVSLLVSTNSFSRTVRVQGYTKSNGTVVRSYERTSPDSTRSNNFGRPSSYSNYQEVYHPETRDQDRDGIVNTLDADDNNNGLLDDEERN